MIHLQEETQEYASEAKLRELVKRYSEFINFPIRLYESKEIDVPVEEDEDEAVSKPTTEDIEDEGSLGPSVISLEQRPKYEDPNLKQLVSICEAYMQQSWKESGLEILNSKGGA